MTAFLTSILILLNAIANALGRVLLVPLGLLPENLGAVLVAIVSGIGCLWIFKFTSNQTAIRQVREQMKANLFAQTLFTDDFSVILRSQWSVVIGAIRLIGLAFVPMLVMLLPISLLMAQLSLWWQFRPLRVNDDAVVTLNLNGDAAALWPKVKLEPNSAIESTLGPVRVRSQRAVCWNVKAKEPGYHKLVFDVDGQRIEKELAIGSRLMRVSVRRPGSGRGLMDVFMYPAENPFAPTSAIKSIDVQYASSDSWITGRDWWVYFWGMASTIAALLFSRVMRVHV